MPERKKLLLADDSVTIQKVVNLTFADEGIEVVTVGDGDAAMEKFVEFAPDLVMVDVNMPGTDGYRICEMIKQDAETAHIPVVLLVGSFEPFDEEEAYRVGADGYLTKPFQSIRQLVGKVNALLDAAPASPAIARAQSDSDAGESSSRQDFEENDAEIHAELNSTEDNGGAVPFEDSYAAADDDTIQTAQIGSLPADETQRFSANFATGASSPAQAGEPMETSLDYETEETGEWTETQTASFEDAGAADSFNGASQDAPHGGQIYQSEDEPDTSQEFSGENTGGQNFDDNDAAADASSTRNFSWDFDDLNLLELPHHEGETDDAGETENQVEPAEVQTIEPISAEPPAPAVNFSPELIEQIAARVAEKLSDRVIKALSPQMSELIAEELEKQ